MSLPLPNSREVIEVANDLANGRVQYFGSLDVKLGSCPNWFLNPYSGTEFAQTAAHWSELSDFDAEVGDIKTIWEPSRFAWCLNLVQATLVSGDASYVETANTWIVDWLKANPYNAGPNWMCGQETSIRLIHVVLADFLLRKHANGESELEEFVFQHCQRIKATRSYAIAQNNNHVISEAAGLLIGGHWLVIHGKQQKRRGRKIRDMGMRMIETQVRKLVLSDGTFSQFSTNYHRVFLDTLSMVEWWRSEFELPDFSSEFYDKARQATRWLLGMIDNNSGDVPNIGANDGAYIYRLSSSGFRDYRPTAQLAATLFLGKKAIEQAGPWDAPLAWLGVDELLEAVTFKRTSCHSVGGFAVLRHADIDSFAVCRGASRSFRPSQADGLHCDIWWQGVNLARDAGTYSYASDDNVSAHYKGTAAHNTVQFDSRDQMRTIGRFLFSDWLKCDSFDASLLEGHSRWSAGYTDYKGCSHYRTVEEIDGGWKVIDRLNGPFDKATLRWRLTPEWEWDMDANSVRSKNVSVLLESDVPFASVQIEEGHESRYYLEETSLPVFAATVTTSGCEIISTFRANDR